MNFNSYIIILNPGIYLEVFFFDISYIYSGVSFDILTKKTYIITQKILTFCSWFRQSDMFFILITLTEILWYLPMNLTFLKISIHKSDLFFFYIYPRIRPFFESIHESDLFDINNKSDLFLISIHESDLFLYLFMNLTFFYIYPWIRPFLYLSMNLSFFDIYLWIFDLFDIYQMNESVTFFDTSFLWLL